MVRGSRILVSVWVIFLISVAGGCRRQESVRMGFLGGMTGRVADLGTAGRNGAMLAVEERNAAGGVKGRPVELLIRDDQQNPDTARQVITELIAQDLSCIIGPMTSSVAMAVVPQVNASKTILISPTVTTTKLSATDDNFLRVISTTAEYASKSAHFQVERLGHRKFSVIYDLSNRAYTEDWFGGFRRAAERVGGEFVAVKQFTSTDQTLFLPIAKELLQAKPDCVVIIANAVDAAMITQQIRSLDQLVSIVMSEWASTERFIELAGKSAEGATVAQFINRNDASERYRTFREKYLARFRQEPGFAGVAGYDAATLALDALVAQQSGETLKDAIIRMKQFQGIQNSIRIDRFGDASRSSFVTVIRDGKYCTVE